MHESLIVPRRYTITFAGGTYKRDMPDNPASRPLFPGLTNQPLAQTSEVFFQTPHQKQLYARLSNNK